MARANDSKIIVVSVDVTKCAIGTDAVSNARVSLNKCKQHKMGVSNRMPSSTGAIKLRKKSNSEKQKQYRDQ